jgi:hypothetical protein
MKIQKPYERFSSSKAGGANSLLSRLPGCLEASSSILCTEEEKKKKEIKKKIINSYTNYTNSDS